MHRPIQRHRRAWGIEQFDSPGINDICGQIQKHFPNLVNLDTTIKWHIENVLFPEGKSFLTHQESLRLHAYYSYYLAVKPADMVLFRMKVDILLMDRGTDYYRAKKTCWVNYGPSDQIKDPRPWYSKLFDPLTTRPNIFDED